MGHFLQAVWTGFKLRCPACGRGPILNERRAIYLNCPGCGARLYRPDDADWLVVWLSGYTAASIVLIGLIAAFQLFTDLGIGVQIAVSTALAALVLALGYANFKGGAVGILYVMRSRWRE